MGHLQRSLLVEEVDGIRAIFEKGVDQFRIEAVSGFQFDVAAGSLGSSSIPAARMIGLSGTQIAPPDTAVEPPKYSDFSIMTGFKPA